MRKKSRDMDKRWDRECIQISKEGLWEKKEIFFEEMNFLISNFLFFFFFF